MNFLQSGAGLMNLTHQNINQSSPFGGRKDQKMLTLSDMTPDEFKQARKVLGLSHSKMAHQLEVSDQAIQAAAPTSTIMSAAVL